MKCRGVVQINSKTSYLRPYMLCYIRNNSMWVKGWVCHNGCQEVQWRIQDFLEMGDTSLKMGAGRQLISFTIFL